MSADHRLTAPLTRAQKFQWRLEKGLAQNTWYLPDTMSENSVRALVEHLQTRFEVLRTSIDLVEGELRQVVHRTGPRLTVVDLNAAEHVSACCALLARDFVARRQGRLGEMLAWFALVRGARAKR